MSVDIVEIGLDSLTDHGAFEKLASEIMRDEGYSDIQPLGGVADRGRDAIQESYFVSEGRRTVVFQYTLQHYLAGKIEETIDKLSKTDTEYDQLVIVTHHRISTATQDDMIRKAWKEHQVTLRIFERKTLVNRLADFENGIFARHFPDIRAQLAVLASSKPILSSQQSELLESSMLKASIALTFGKGALHVRKSIFDFLTLGLLLEHSSDGLSIDELVQKYGETVGAKKPPSEQVTASLERLASRGLVETVASRTRPTARAVETTSSTTIQANEATESLISDIIHEVQQVSGQRLSQQNEGRLARNTQDVLVTLFRLFGIELANQVLQDATPAPLYLDSLQELLSTAKRQLSPQLGEVLISVISDTFRSPTEEQAETLARWSLAYLGTAIMNLDPYLREFQATRISHKMFILDTDFVLDCVVQECSRSKTYLRLIQTLVNHGCRVIIPESCFEECMVHARVAPQTYRHFGRRLHSLGDAFVDEKVGNLFVRGYYYGQLAGTIPPNMTFYNYLRNYHNPQSPVAFFNEVVQYTFPEGVEILNPTTLLTEAIPEEQRTALRTELLDLALMTAKAAYRTPEENKHLADTDARLFLTALCLNRDLGNASGEVLGGLCYLVTGSARYLRSAKEIGLKDTATTRPQSLIALLELVGDLQIESTDFVKLFENPLLTYAVSQVWDDVKVLLDAGVILRGKSIPRLRCDLEQRLHNRIAAFKEADTRAESTEEEDVLHAADSEYLNLLESASSLGYTHMDFLRSLVERAKRAEDDARTKAEALDELSAKYEELEKTIAHFGKRRQRYLRRVARSQTNE